MVKEDEKTLKKRKTSPEPKATTSMEEETPSTPSAAEVEEILKIMTESLPIKMLRQQKRWLGLKSEELLLLCKLLRKRHRRPQHQR
jgi:hypothetical protein